MFCKNVEREDLTAAREESVIINDLVVTSILATFWEKLDSVHQTVFRQKACTGWS